MPTVKSTDFLRWVGYLKARVSRSTNYFAVGRLDGEVSEAPTALDGPYPGPLMGVVDKVKRFIDAVDSASDVNEAAASASKALPGVIDVLRVMHLELGDKAAVADLQQKNRTLLAQLLKAESAPKPAVVSASASGSKKDGDDAAAVGESPVAADTIVIDGDTYRGIIQSLRALMFTVHCKEHLNRVDPFGMALLAARGGVVEEIGAELEDRVKNSDPDFTMRELSLLSHGEFVAYMNAQAGDSADDADEEDDNDHAHAEADGAGADEEPLFTLPADDWIKTFLNTDYRSRRDMAELRDMAALAGPIDPTSPEGVERLLAMDKKAPFDAEAKVNLFKAVLAVRGLALKTEPAVSDDEKDVFKVLFNQFNADEAKTGEYGVCSKTIPVFCRSVDEDRPQLSADAISSLDRLLYGLNGQTVPSASARRAYAMKVSMFGKAETTAAGDAPAPGQTGGGK